MSSQIGKRVAEFKERFSQMFGARAQGYDELNTLERPLFNAEDDEDYERGTTAAGYEPPATTGERPAEPRGESLTAVLPSQSEEMQELSVLAKDAAEIMWEMVALGEGGAAMAEMKARAEQLQAQLRGLINDYTGGDEKLFASAFESFDMLTRSLDDQVHVDTQRKNETQDDVLEPSRAPTTATDSAGGIGGDASFLLPESHTSTAPTKSNTTSATTLHPSTVGVTPSQPGIASPSEAPLIDFD